MFEVDDSYSLFLRYLNGKTRIIMVAPKYWKERPDLPYVLYCDLSFNAGANGLPLPAEGDRMANLETKLIEMFSQQGAVHLGHITSTAGAMRVVFRSGSAGPEKVSVKTGILSKVEIPLISREDKDWNWFEENMVPTAAEQYETQFRMLYAQLAGAGDDHSKARNVEFAANFETDENRKAFLDAVVSEGYSTEKAKLWEPDGQYWCTFHQLTNIEWTPMSQKHVQLKALAERFNGSFDGWETPVAK